MNLIFESRQKWLLEAYDPLNMPLAERERAFADAMKKLDISVPDDIVHKMCYMPASCRHHGNYEGGLILHSWNVVSALCAMTDALTLEWQNVRSPILVGFFHDLCKTDLYEFTDSGIIYASSAAPGHGEKSVYLIKQFIPDLTEEEELCIRWHMGAFDEKDNWKYYSEAVSKYPNVLFTHTADMVASQILEKE